MIRTSNDSDRAAIEAVHLSAFGPAQGAEIFQLVDDLLADATAAPRLSLVAEANGAVVGYSLFTRALVEPGDQDIAARILAPLAVASGFQGRGLGAALITEGLRQLTVAGVDLVFVLGHPAYYPRHGFRPAGAIGLEAPYPIPEVHADAWMVQALRPGLIGTVRGTVRCARALDEPRHWRE